MFGSQNIQTQRYFFFDMPIVGCEWNYFGKLFANDRCPLFKRDITRYSRLNIRYSSIVDSTVSIQWLEIYLLIVIPSPIRFINYLDLLPFHRERSLNKLVNLSARLPEIQMRTL